MMAVAAANVPRPRMTTRTVVPATATTAAHERSAIEGACSFM
jgi:hypothetical protein